MKLAGLLRRIRSRRLARRWRRGKVAGSGAVARAIVARFFTLRGNRVVTVTAPRLTSADTFDSEPAAPEDAVGFHGLKKIGGARWLKAATRAGTSRSVNDRGDEALISADEQADDEFHATGSISGGGNKSRARLAAFLQSSWSSANVASEARQRAMVTIQTPS